MHIYADILYADTPLPNGLHLRVEPCHVPGCKEPGRLCKLCLETDQTLIYNLHISKSMTLSGGFIQMGEISLLKLAALNHALNQMLTKFGRAMHLNGWPVPRDTQGG